MEILIYVFLVFFALAVLFLIIEYPYHLTGVMIFMMVYRFNFELPLPIDSRGLLTIALFARLYFFDQKNAAIINSYLLKNKIFWLIVIFSLTVIVVPIIHSDKITNLLKDIILNWVALIVGFLILIDNNGKVVFKYSIIVIGSFASIDLLYTNITGGGLHIQRVLDVILQRNVRTFNHNFPGMLSGLGLFFIYLLHVRKEAPKVITLFLGIFLLSGLILSTSRSALLSLIIIFGLMNFIEEDLRGNIKKFFMMGVGAVIMLVVFFFMYNLFLKTTGKNNFIDKVYYRLYDEPLQVLGMSRANYDKYSGKEIEGSMKFRAKKWSEDFNKFQNFSLLVQSFGLGPKGYSKISKKEYRTRGKFAGNVRRQLAAHNGYLLLLVERGILGLVLYLLILISVSVSAFRVIRFYQLTTPVIYLFLFIAFYSFAQNAELVSASAYLILGGILGNIYSATIDNDHNEDYEYEII
jgi:hypothetical protein